MAFEIPEINFFVVAPVIIAASTAMLLMLVELFAPNFIKKWAAWISFLGLGIALIFSISAWFNPGATFTPLGGPPMLVADNFATFFNIIFILTGMLTVLISFDFLHWTGLDRPEYYMLMLLSITGMMLMGMSNDLILTFLALELLSIPLYIMAGLAWPRPESEESAMKYFLLGAFSSAIFVFGIALLYGATGTTALPEIVATIEQASPLALAGAAFLLVGFGFKVAAVPFQMWTPDVYEGAPTSVTAFMSVGAKVGGFAAMLRILLIALPDLGTIWVPAIAVLSALTLIIGNVTAITQQNIKRLLGYSSIAHAGFILIAVAASANSSSGLSAALFYMFAYLFTNLGAFAVVIAMEHKIGEGVLLEDYKGLAKEYPWLAIAMTLFMLSLAGVPPTIGFAAKFYVFRAAVEAQLVWLAIIGVITSVVSAFYYLRVVYYMFMFDGEVEVMRRPALVTAMVITAVVVFLFGILPAWGWSFAAEAVFQSVQSLAALGG
ncbi:MAG: NADH-quinone oxidoreductase subunit N [Candidatus Promineifilaceae bacterium]|jgi:NADH-quinone oxidoreductase subunit N